MKKLVKCKECGKNFLRPQYEIKRKKNGIFCSMKCWGKWKSINIRGSKHWGWKKGIIGKCLICGKEFKVADWEIKKGRGKFCSKKCWYNYLNESGGKNHPHWKGGITPLNQKIKNGIEYRLWREAVYSRDNWTCQECGTRGGRLNAHHIKPFAKFPELRFAIDNGITLCIKCHLIIRHNQKTK